ncbi:MAG: hypothetical protein ACR2HQ_14530 [Ilumatobacteraceae bacterium]
MATEAHFRINVGFWGLRARGATFKHGTQQRATQPGRHLVRDNRARLGAAEAIGNEHQFAWAMGKRTPVGLTFDRLSRLREALPDGNTLTVRCPTLEFVDRTDRAKRR